MLKYRLENLLTTSNINIEYVLSISKSNLLKYRINFKKIIINSIIKLLYLKRSIL